MLGEKLRGEHLLKGGWLKYVNTVNPLSLSRSSRVEVPGRLIVGVRKRGLVGRSRRGGWKTCVISSIGNCLGPGGISRKVL